jgi:hypothetical protein
MQLAMGCTPNGSWFTPGLAANSRSNTGGASAICMLTAASLYRHLGSGSVPVGAVESCQSATNVGELELSHADYCMPGRTQRLPGLGNAHAVHTLAVSACD